MDQKIFEELKTALKIEEEGMRFYKECAEKTSDENGKKMFDFLAVEEVRHFQVVRDLLYEEIQRVGDVPPSDVSSLFEGSSGIFPSKVAGGRVWEMSDELDAINIGIEAEKNSIRLYKDMENISQNKNKKNVFMKLVNEEEKHLAILEKELEFVTDTGEFHDFKTVTT